MTKRYSKLYQRGYKQSSVVLPNSSKDTAKLLHHKRSPLQLCKFFQIPGKPLSWFGV